MTWSYRLLGVIILLGAVYTLIPDLVLHRLGIGSWKRQYTSGVALTLDDGPNPETTPVILDILAEYRVQAVFFMTGDNAAKYPDLVQEVQKRGHQIGAHSMQHRYAWFMTPWTTWREWDSCIQVLENLTGQPVQWVRPPWGTFNFATWLWIRARRKRAVLWNVEGHDWQARRTPEQIAGRVLRRSKEGAIIVLHDAGGEQDAPKNTVEALHIICSTIVKEKKLPLVRLEFPGWVWWRCVIFAAWEKWERFFARKYQVERINSTNFLCLAKKIYKGPDIYSGEGMLLAKTGDEVGEIHLDSGRLLDNDSSVSRAALHALHLAKECLPELALYIAENPEYGEIKVFLGLTLINRGVKGLGFHVQDMQAKGIYRIVGILQNVIMWIYNPNRKSRGGVFSGGTPKIVWISRQELLKRWLPVKNEQKFLNKL